jgi:hypothetical protein
VDEMALLDERYRPFVESGLLQRVLSYPGGGDIPTLLGTLRDLEKMLDQGQALERKDEWDEKVNYMLGVVCAFNNMESSNYATNLDIVQTTKSGLYTNAVIGSFRTVQQGLESMHPLGSSGSSGNVVIMRRDLTMTQATLRNLGCSLSKKPCRPFPTLGLC